MAKLTLSADPEIIEEAKRLAKKSGTSVSALFASMVKAASSHQQKPKLGPLTRQLSGIIKMPAGKDYRETVTEALMEKYGFK
jgi:hypothetical protein